MNTKALIKLNPALLALPLLCLSFISKPSITHAGEGKLGEVRYSILTVEQFQSLYGRDWVLMDGGDISTTDLFALWGQQYMPDARGLYLRAANNGRDPKFGNPDLDPETELELKLGTYQEDAFKCHNHGGGNHSHGHNGFRFVRDGGEKQVKSREHFPGDPFDYGGEASGTIIRTEGGSETRPRTLIVNAFIKVNDSTLPAASSSSYTGTDPKKTAKIRALVKNPEFRDAVSDVVKEMMSRDR